MGKNERIDAVRVKDLDPFHSIVPYVMPKRTESEVCLRQTFDVTELMKYMRKRNDSEEGLRLKLFHAICTAFARTVYLRPGMNRFIAGRRYWQRKDVLLSFVAKQSFADDSEETLMFLHVTPEMNIDDVSRKIIGDVAKVRESSGNDLDKTMRLVGSLPRFVLEILFFVLRRLEYHGIFPRSLMQGDPNYSTVLMANMGSLKSDPPYHHLNNYGTCSCMVTIGTMRIKDVKQEDGTYERRELLDMMCTLDERIADGFYFMKSLRYIRYMFEHPEVMEERMDAPLPEPSFK